MPVEPDRPARSLDRSVLVGAAFPARLMAEHGGPVVAGFSTTNASPADHGDFNLSPTTAHRHGEDEERVGRNLAVLRELCGRPMARLKQVHSATVVDLDQVEESDAGFAPLARTEADAMVTTRRGCALAILTGDCTPLLLVDGRRGVFAAAHSGRLGTERNIAGAVIGSMRSKGSDPADIHAWIGPHICGDCYETGGRIADCFEQRFPGCSTLTRFGGRGVSLGRAIARELVEAGVPHGNIIDAVAGASGTDPANGDAAAQAGHRHACCTLEDKRFYSYRGYTLTKSAVRDGRFYTVLVI